MERYGIKLTFPMAGKFNIFSMLYKLVQTRTLQY
jgi:hypothetical protein